jgi:hypothetical protein
MLENGTDPVGGAQVERVTFVELAGNRRCSR